LKKLIKNNFDITYYSWTSWLDYLKLEEELISFMKIIPPHDQNKNVWSHQLANMLIIIATRLESFIKSSLSSKIWEVIDEHTDNFPLNILHEIKAKKKHLWNIKDYKKFYNNFFRLDSHFVCNKTRGYEKIIPYAEWENDNSPSWWKSYNDLKHDYYSNMPSATLDVVFNALAGFFLIFIIHPEVFSMLAYKREVIKTNFNLPGMIPRLDDTHKILENKISENEKFKEKYQKFWKNSVPPYPFQDDNKALYAESNLFFYIFKTSSYDLQVKVLEQGIENNYMFFNIKPSPI